MSLIRARFEKDVNKLVSDYTSSLRFDSLLYAYDIEGSMAHAKMLGRQGIITQKESRAIVRGLKKIRQEIEDGDFEFKPELEDIHMAVEARLIELTGDTGRKLHTARSRNDQVALDLRLFLQDVTLEALSRIRALESALVLLASDNKDVVMPGYTHLQLAQPVLFAHHLLAYFEMLERDRGRLVDGVLRTSVMPLGAGALAGVTYDIDRKYVAKQLDFIHLSRNSMDAVSDRDFVIEFEAAASIMMMHLSRLAEEIILWSSAEFDFIELDDAYATSSSIMPQKKNPDVAELARGKTGRVYGNLMAILTTMKGLPLTYNRDLQEDKEGLFDTIDTILTTLDVFTGLISTLKVKKDNMKAATEKGYMLATDIADYLVKKGEAFRNAHAIVAKLVGYAISQHKTFKQLILQEYKQFSPLFEKDVYDITVASSVAARNVHGGTAPAQVEEQLKNARAIIGEKDAKQD